MMILSDRLATMRSSQRRTLDSDLLARLETHVSELRAPHVRNHIAHVGTRAPMFALPTRDGTIVDSETLLNRGPLIVSFFRGTWCDFCVAELDAIADAYSALRAAGGEVVVITPQTFASSAERFAANPVPFAVLHDACNRVAHAYGVAVKLSESARSLYRALGHDLEVANGDEAWTVPLAARFVLGVNGIVREVEADSDFRDRPEPLGALPIIETLAKQNIRI